MEQAPVTLTPRQPYDFNLTASSAVSFRDRYGTNWFDGAVFRRLLDLKGKPCLISVHSVGTPDSPRLEGKVTGTSLDEATVAAAKHQIAWLLDTDTDLSPFYAMASQDPILAPLVGGLRGLHLPHTASVFEALILAILGQQISSQVAYQLRTRLTEIYGAPMKIEGVTYHAFPHPEALLAAGVAGLRALKFSARKAKYIFDIADAVASGKLALEELRYRPDDEVIRRLTSIRGAGHWTAHWLLISALGRSDGFPHNDLALRRTLGLLFNQGEPFPAEEALRYSGRWSPFRSYVTAYLFAAVRSGRLAELSGSQPSSHPMTEPGIK
ncbi:MAG: DNA-3-methyladenine glycosylase 2 [Chloroflexi bacterium]|nr:DNA-3-methyladenine glycosylase 2 [Chloroflexota bacterium]